MYTDNYSDFKIMPGSIPILLNSEKASFTQLDNAAFKAETIYGSYTIRVFDDFAEFELLCNNAEQAMENIVPFPWWVAPEKDDLLFLPMGEGTVLPVAEPEELWNRDFITRSFCSRESTMSMFVIGRKNAERYSYIGVFVENGADAQATFYKTDNGLWINRIEWLPEKGKVGYTRRVRLVAADTLGEICSEYRKYREHYLNVRTLKQKAEVLPRLEELAGAPDIWLWHPDYEKVMYSACDKLPSIENTEAIKGCMEELHGVGVDKCLLSLFFKQDEPGMTDYVSSRGDLLSKYDNYDDVPPADIMQYIPRERIFGCDYSSRRVKDYPMGVRINENGDYAQAWALPGTDGKRHNQVKLCPKVAYERICEEVPELSKGYSCRFIDCLGLSTAECYSKEHPLTRNECLEYKQNSFKALEPMGLISGTEDCIEEMIPYCVYTEGLGSPVNLRYRYKECGREKAQIRQDEEAIRWFREYTTNPLRRVPLFELVWHDCMVIYPYWGESTLCCMDAEVILRKLLFSLLYSTPQLYSLFTSDIDKVKTAISFIDSTTCNWLRRNFYAKMVGFEYLTADRMVQRTTFDNGASVTVDFNTNTYTLS